MGTMVLTVTCPDHLSYKNIFGFAPLLSFRDS